MPVLFGVSIGDTMKKLILSTAIAVIPLPVLAEENQSVEEIIVTATRVEQPVHKVLASASIISRDDIEKSSATNLPELLARYPGIDFSTSGSRGSDSSVFMRGTSGDHTLILIDGVRTSSATNGKTDLQRIPLVQIERIEIVRGPRSSLYGAEAIGGVIQIFTRDPKGGVVTAEVGSDDLRKGSFSYGGGNKSTKFRITAGHEKTNGFDSTESNGATDDDRDGYEEESLNVAVNHTFINDYVVGVSGTIIDSSAEFDSGDEDFTDGINEILTAHVKAPLTKQLSAKLEVGRYKDETDNHGKYESFFNTERSSVSAQLDYSFTDNHALTVGHDYHDDEVDSSNSFTEDSRYNKAYFAQYQSEFGEMSLSGSYRSDDNESFGTNETHSVSSGYHFSDDTLVAVSYGTAFKAPTFNDLYYPFTDYGSWGTYTGNSDLEPEESESYEIMMRSQWKSVVWDLSYYETKIDNLIEYSLDAMSNGTMENISNVKITGAEFTANFVLQDWVVTTLLSYTDPRDEGDDELIANRARGKASMSANKDFDDINVGFHWVTQSHRFGNKKERMAGYNTVDASVNYEMTSSLELTAKVNNIFDNDYVINKTAKSFDYNTPGTNFSLSARYQFK